VFVMLAAAALGCPSLTTPDMSVTIWQGTLIPAPAQAGLEGQVAVVAQAGGTQIGIGLTGAEPGATYAWGVWRHTCAAPGGPVGVADDYPVLAVNDSGAASGDTSLGLRFSSDSTYHVELRQSVTDTSRIACGNLVLQ
jgi:hypothetical protein